jgi:hypothetical protein
MVGGAANPLIYIDYVALVPTSLTDRSNYLAVARSATRERVSYVSFSYMVFVFETYMSDATTKPTKCQYHKLFCLQLKCISLRLKMVMHSDRKFS